MAYQTTEVCKLTPTIGAETHGADLSQASDNQQYPRTN
jgi:hypothetical protein